MEAQKNLGAFYSTGVGVAKDEAKGAYWYRKAAEQGDAESQLPGLGIPIRARGANELCGSGQLVS